MLADVGGFALALFAINYTRKPATPQRTYGFYRMEILASLVNSVVLVLLSAYILYEGFRRIFEPPEIQSLPIIIVERLDLQLILSECDCLVVVMRKEEDNPMHMMAITKISRKKNWKRRSGKTRTRKPECESCIFGNSQ